MKEAPGENLKEGQTPKSNHYLTPADIHPATRYLNKNNEENGKDDKNS